MSYDDLPDGVADHSSLSKVDPAKVTIRTYAAMMNEIYKQTGKAWTLQTIPDVYFVNILDPDNGNEMLVVGDRIQAQRLVKALINIIVPCRAGKILSAVPALPKESSASEQAATAPLPPIQATPTPLPLVQATNPAPAGPSLEVTMKFIGDFLTAQSPVGWQLISDDHNGDDPNREADSISYRNFRQDGCILRFEEKMASDSDWDSTYHDFSKQDPLAIKIDTEAASMTRRSASHCRLRCGTTWQTSPEIYLVGAFDVSDQVQAGRLAKAMIHASVLCGGGKGQPF
jgi:hypothetical protein